MSQFLYTSVTAVKIYKNLIFAGIGSYANIFDKTSSDLLKCIQCLNGQKIYGFIPNENEEVLIYGGKQFTILKIDQGRNELFFSRVFEPITCDDWLHSAVWINHEKFALLTAHNVVQNWTNSETPVLTSKQLSSDNSILYSGLLVVLQDGVLVLAGTVYSEVILHHDGNVMHRLTGHKGVIFSISCDTRDGAIVTTSDDRSVRIWTPNEPHDSGLDTLALWSRTNIVCIRELYGHSSRVMRNFMLNDLVVSIGEDSSTCFWGYDGNLLKKVVSHQNGGIWSIDSDENEVVTGGSDGAVIIHPLTVIDEHQAETFRVAQPKKIFITAKNNIVVLTEDHLLVHCNVERKIETRHRLYSNMSHKIISLSPCKQMIAVTDMNGKINIFIENSANTALLTKGAETILNIGNILTMNWVGNRHLVLCSFDGKIYVVSHNDRILEVEHKFLLPHCKERWLTAAAAFKDMFAFGDRCGNMHIFVKTFEDPVTTFNKIHGRYGPTSISIRDNEIITTGRDGTVKLFAIKADNKVELTYTQYLDFQWVDRFLNKDDNMVCGFQEIDFVVYDLKKNVKICEIPCGGGHRSWDAMTYIEKVEDKFEEIIKFVYIKNNNAYINKFVLSKMVSRNLIDSYHGKVINCLKTFKIEGNHSFVTGSEDTTLRISAFGENKLASTLAFKHLSNIKTVKTYNLDPSKILVVSGGGRAQIVASIINLRDTSEEMVLKPQILTDFMIKGIDKMRNNNQDWRNSTIDFDPETRIMDLDFIQTNDTFKIYAGCSDALLRVFKLTHVEKWAITLLHEVKYHKTCILKIKHIEFLNRNIIITCTTHGEVAFWGSELTRESTPFYELVTNKSGINSIAIQISTERLIIATGGDDNAIHVLVLEPKSLDDLSSLRVQSTLVLETIHSSQVTGLLLVDKYLISASIDQRVTLIELNYKQTLEYVFVNQIFSDVADIQGMELLEHKSTLITVCVYGNGMEILNLNLPRK